MENTVNLSIILPLKTSLVKDFSEFFGKAINSINESEVKPNELVIVYKSDEKLNTFLNEFDFGNISVNKVEFSNEPNYCEQINEGIKQSKSEWVSFFEFDDEYSKIWFKNFKKYSESYTDVDAFLPIVVDVDDKLVFAGFTNEATFAANVSSEIGILTNETLQTFQNFQISGMVFSKDKFLDMGGLKSNLKLVFGYELFLRLTHNSLKIMTIPKIGYKHINLREGSIFWNYKNGEEKMTQDEAIFWIESAKKEYFYNNDREIKYESQEI